MIFICSRIHEHNKRKKGNLIGIEKGTINRNKKTNKNNEKYKGKPDSYTNHNNPRKKD